MRTIEHELDEAANALRELSREIPHRRWVEPQTHRRSRLFVVAAATGLVLLAIGLPALLTTNGDPSDTAGSGTVTDSDPVTDSMPLPLPEPSASQDPALAPLLSVLPQGFDLEAATAVFSLDGVPDEVAIRYLEDRLRENAESRGLRIESVQPAGLWLVARWAWETEEGENAAGNLILLEHDGIVDVLAATTDGVDLSELALVEGRLSGTIIGPESGNLGSDVLDQNGQPVAGSPYPDGFIPEADFLWGTAGASETGPLTIDIAPITDPVTVRVNLVGGGLLTISEVGLSPAD